MYDLLGDTTKLSGRSPKETDFPCGESFQLFGKVTRLEANWPASDFDWLFPKNGMNRQMSSLIGVDNFILMCLSRKVVKRKKRFVNKV